jgi:hypothetical protein
VCEISNFSFIINDEIHGSLKPTRGLRQGDPLSPYLFLICAEGLSRLLYNAETTADIAGFRCSMHGPKITHLLFADDSMVFTKASVRDCQSIKSVLSLYACASGQVVNYQKSAMCVSKGVAKRRAIGLARIVGVRLVACHDRYLGLPSFAGRNKKEIFSNVREKVWQKLHGWKNKLFSAGGKEILIKAVVQSVPCILCLCLGFPKD